MDRIETKKMIEQFSAHLNNVNNQRIIFSGSFGSGKTTFLKEFFENSEMQGKYFLCKLFPVNYVTSNNKDIYELIKFDVLLQLLGSGISIERTDFDKCMTIGKSLKNHSLKLIQSIVESFSLVNEDAKIIEKALDVIADIYEDYKEEKPQNKINRFLTELENKTGSSYELNSISLLIREMLIKASNLGGTKKETVLLIDDFDRLEPMQSFRLLNILSVNDNETNINENKFGFDKIIIVCDINNLRDCFIHINGTANAFNGYIDKFYSTQIFEFNIKEDLVRAMSRWFAKINIRKDVLDEFYQRYLNVIQCMINCGSLNIRSPTKMQSASLNVPITRFYDTRSSCDYMKLFFMVLQEMFAADQELSNAIYLCSRKSVMMDYLQNSGVISDALCNLYPKAKNREEIEYSMSSPTYKFKLTSDTISSHWELISINGEPLGYNSEVPVFSLIEEVKRRYLNL